MKTKTQFTNRILSLVLSIMMVVSMLPMNVLTASAAEGDKVSVTIGGETTYYTSIIDAVAKANESDNATITLLQDTTTGERLDITKSTALDLNGNTLSCATNFSDDYDTMVAVTANGAKLTIIDSIGGGKLDGTGTTFVLCLGDPSWQGAVTFTSSAQISGGTVSGGVRMRGGTSMTVSGGTLENNTAGLATIEMQSETTLNVSGGEILNTVFAGDAISNMDGGTVIISGGTVNASGGYARAIRTQNSGGVEISGGNIFGAQYDLSFSSDDTVELAGGTFPGGITIYGKTLNESLGNGFSYWAVVGGQNTMLTVATDATGITDKGDITIRATCNHSGNTNDYTDNVDGTHSFTCTVCQTAVNEAHTFTNGVCSACDYVCPHSNFDSATGNCKDCETSLAIAKIKTGETTIYYQTADDLRTAIADNSADQAITLLADLEIKDTIDVRNSVGTKNTLDLNGHTLICSDPIKGRILLEYGELEITGTGSINIFMSANDEGTKIVVGSGVTLNNSLRSAYGGVLDLTNATIPEAGLNVILYSDYWDTATYNVSDVLLLPADYYFFVDGKAVYTYSGETEGTVLKHTDYSYTYTDNGDGTHDATCTACGAVVDNEPHTPDADGYTVGTEGTHSFTCVCGTTVTEAHTYDDEDGTCACGAVKTYTVTFNPYGDSGAKIVEINGEAVEIFHGGTFTAPHGQELKVKFENTVSQKETGVYCDAWGEDLSYIDYDYDEDTNTMTIPANEVNRDFFIAPSAYVSVQFDLHGGTLTDDGRELLVERFGYTWDAETSTLKAGYSFNFALRPEYFQLAGHTLAGAKVDGSDEVVYTLSVKGDMTVDILWECGGTTTLTSVPAKDATCTTEGNIAHYVCTCGKLYEDEAGTKELTAEEVKTDIDLTNHVGMDTATGKCACGLKMAGAKVTSAGVDTYYEILKAALADAKSGDTVTLCKSAGITDDHTIPAGVTFVGGEYSVSNVGTGMVTNNGTIACGKFDAYVQNNGTVSGGDFTDTLVNGGTVTGGSFSRIDCHSGSTLSGSFQFNLLVCFEECTMDLSNAIVDGSAISNNKNEELTAGSLNLPEGYALKLNNNVVSALSAGETGFIESHTHTYETRNNETHHWTVCACGKTTAQEEHTYTYADNGDNHTVGCSGCNYTGTEAHTLTYSANGKVITASCSENCGYSGTATISATGKTYDGTAVEVIVSKTGSLENMIIPVTLTKDGEAFTGEPVNAGTYTASVMLGNKTVSVNFTIAKAEVSITAAPTPNTLTYIGEAQYLISAGEANVGTMVYSLTENGEYTTSIPQGTNAGDYTVWYYVQGDANHNDSAKDSVSVTIAKATPTAEDFVFAAPTDLIYDGTAKPATITVKDGIVGMGEVNVIYFRDAGMWIDNEREPIYPGRYKVGIWIKEGDNYKAVYSGERIWLGSEFEIKYLTTDAKAVISGTVGSNGWYTSDVTLTAPEGYQISKTKYNDGFVSELTFSAEQNETITYYLKDANGDVSEKTATLKIDKTAPSAKYQIGTNGWKQFINTITFGLFCKDYKTVDIEYTDALSGVAEKQYYISSEEITNTSRIAWLDYTDTLSLNATGKYFIYMRVVDNAGNEVILNTEGIVIYEDSIQVTESVSATYNAGTDKAVTVKLNGNTVNAIQNGNAVLTAGTDYTVSADGTITLKASYLDALKAGEYTFTVSYNPQGVETDKVNMTTAFTVKVEKADGKVSNLNISSKTYDGNAVTVPTFDKLGDGAATIEYKVKGADDSTYTTTAPKDAGDYVVRVTVAESENYKAASATAEFTIGRASITGISVKQDGKLTYNGKAQTPTVSTSATTVDGSKVTFTYSTESEGPYSTEIPSFTNAGWTHLVYYRATAENHNASYGSFLVEIEKATVTEPTIASKPYSGSAQTADISDTDLYTVEKNNGGTEKGSYDVVLKLKDSANYKWSTTNNAEVTLQFVISAAQNAWDTNPSISGWTYGEAAKTPVGTAKYGAVKVVYTGKANDGTDYNSETAPTKAGNYTATFTVTGTEDYSGLSEQVNFTIAKKAVTVTANDASKTYGESDFALTYTHTELVGSDALVITVARTSGENANTYTITASQEDSANPNYEITFKTGTFTIHKATLTVTVEDKTATYGDAVPTYTVKYEGFKNGDDKDDLGGALAFECGYAQFSDKGEYTIKASGYTSGNYTISYVDGKLTVNAKPITVTIQNATSVYGDTLAELKATDNGIVNGDTNVYSLATTATGTSNVGKYTITGTALDSNYDVTFVNGEYEITKREITITVDAKNTVVNTTLPTYTYKVEGLVGVDTLVTEPTLTCNANIALIGEYDITATGADAGGNYSIKYVPAKLTVLTDNAVDAAAGYTEELKDYDPATVTSEDKAELEEMLSEINTILADETTTDNGKKALEEVKEQVEKLIKEITDAAEATDTENTEKVENVTPENVTPENKTDLEGAKADLEKALEDNGGNYTEDEKKAIEEEIKRIDDALEVIGNVEAVEEVISKLPAVDTVKPDDEEAIKAITDAQTAYNALSDYEKSLVDEATKANLDKLAAALVAYDIVEGDGSSWTEDSDHNITFVVNGLFGKFVGIKVDGKDVDKANYEVKAGSTIITLKASYLDTLAVGEHTITAVYTDGSTDGTFHVHAKANSPATGDDFNIALYGSLMAVSVTALVVLLLASKKRKQVK